MKSIAVRPAFFLWRLSGLIVCLLFTELAEEERSWRPFHGDLPPLRKHTGTEIGLRADNFIKEGGPDKPISFAHVSPQQEFWRQDIRVSRIYFLLQVWIISLLKSEMFVL